MNDRGKSQNTAQAFPKGTGQPAIRALTAAGYTRVEDLSGARESALRKLHGVGPKAISVIKQALADHNLPPLT